MAQAGGLKDLVGHAGTVLFSVSAWQIQKKLELNVDAYFIVIGPVAAASFFTGHYGCGHCFWLCQAIGMGALW